MKQSFSTPLFLLSLFGVVLEFNPASAQVTPDDTTATTVIEVEIIKPLFSPLLIIED